MPGRHLGGGRAITSATDPHVTKGNPCAPVARPCPPTCVPTNPPVSVPTNLPASVPTNLLASAIACPPGCEIACPPVVVSTGAPMLVFVRCRLRASALGWAAGQNRG